MVDIGDEIREYIAYLASASAGAAQEQAANTSSKGAHTGTSKASPPTLARPIVSSPSWSPPPRPSGSTFLSPSPVEAPFQASPRRLDFTGTPSPRVGLSPQLPLPITPPSLPAREPIAHRTHARAPAPAPLALFTAGRPLQECVTYQMPTAKALWSPVEPIGFAGLCRAMPAAEVLGFAGLCQALSQLDMPEALSVLDLPLVNSLSIANSDAIPATRQRGTLPMPTS
jgi:hypothetical protein